MPDPSSLQFGVHSINLAMVLSTSMDIWFALSSGMTQLVQSQGCLWVLQSWLLLAQQHPLQGEKHRELNAVDRQALDEALYGGTC